MCDCRKAVDERLAFSNARIAVGFTVSDARDRLDLSSPMIVLEKLDGRKHAKVPILLATCCPFCGKRYHED